MDITILILRILHIVFGAFWVGTDIFFTFVVTPRLRSLGAETERSALFAVMRALPALMMTSSLVTAGSGLVLTGILRGWRFGTLLASGWGIAIFVGFVGTFITLVVGSGLIPPLSIRAERLARAFEGRKPVAAEAAQLDELMARAHAFSRFNAVLLIVVVVSMAVARYV